MILEDARSGGKGSREGRRGKGGGRGGSEFACEDPKTVRVSPPPSPSSSLDICPPPCPQPPPPPLNTALIELIFRLALLLIALHRGRKYTLYYPLYIESYHALILAMTSYLPIVAVYTL